jgi:hypothetical protein
VMEKCDLAARLQRKRIQFFCTMPWKPAENPNYKMSYAECILLSSEKVKPST